MLKKDKFFDDRIKSMLEEESIESQKIYEQNRINNMTPTERMVHRYTNEIIKDRELNESANFFRKLTFLQKLLFIVLQTSACILTCTLIAAIKYPDFGVISVILTIMCIALGLILILVIKLKKL